MAKKCYEQHQSTTHVDLSLANCGIFLYSKIPYIGSSPDAVIECSCYGKDILEVKCPHSIVKNNKDISSLPYIENGELNTKHNYYYQVQSEMACAGVQYADICIWCPTHLFIQRILLDETFVEEMFEKSS